MNDNWSSIADQHWKKFLPKYYKSLKKQGILEQQLQRAGEDASEMIADLVTKGLNPIEAREIVLPQFIYLTPEKDQPKIFNDDRDSDIPFEGYFGF